MVHSAWTGRASTTSSEPTEQEIFRNFPTRYYGTGFPCEWATDIMFRPGTLARLAPLLLEHGMLSFSSPDVMQSLQSPSA